MLKIVEIFTSIDGEVNHCGQGSFSTFIRLWGCNLTCSYCDTTYAMVSGNFRWMSVKDLLKEVFRQGCRKVTLTGGDPLLQKGTPELLSALLAHHFEVSVETNGSMPPPVIRSPYDSDDWAVSMQLSWIYDYKLHSSGMTPRMMSLGDFARLPANSWIKMVISHAIDFDQAVGIVRQLKTLHYKGHVAFSPCMGEGHMPASEIVQRLINLKIFDIVVNLQIHKFIFPDGEKIATSLI